VASSHLSHRNSRYLITAYKNLDFFKKLLCAFLACSKKLFYAAYISFVSFVVNHQQAENVASRASATGTAVI
jgi:hypothetical protein